ESFHRLRKARGIDVRPRDKAALQKWQNVNHDATADSKGKNYKSDDKLFGFDWNDPDKKVKPSVCILSPENVWGPFFADRAAYRQNIRENQEGVYQRLALQIIDVTTCKPLKGARIDVWQANATGLYARQVRDWPPNENAHWLTGAQSTSSWGTVDFDTIFPGHYSGRAVHTHLSVRPTEKLNDPDGFVHKGQIFYDEYARQEIDKLKPYSSNRQELVLTINDGWAQAVATDKVDPFAHWAWLDGANHQAGLVTWITVGVNSSAHVKNQD
ncbi:aromatic compound dioxygenase, partial [Karstenula rhodostoma CBS 690.94]